MTTANPKSAQKEIEAIYPLAPSQQGMLLETLAASRPGVHVEQFILSLTGDLQVDAFRAAWQAVVQRHASLRTAFVWKGQSEPRQVVLKQVQIPLEQQDWRDRTPSDQQASLEAYLQADRLQGFTLTKAPLLRLALFQLGDRDYRCVWTFHHILIDLSLIHI